MLRKLLEKLKAKLRVTKEEYESHFQEDLRNKNFIVADGLQAIKLFASQDNQDALVLDRNRTQNQGRGVNQGFANNRPIQQYSQKPQPRQRGNARFPEVSLKELMEMVKQ